MDWIRVSVRLPNMEQYTHVLGVHYCRTIRELKHSDIGETDLFNAAIYKGN